MTRILLVDDEENVLNALRRELRTNYEIETFSNPGDALARSKEVAFDLVISDYQMPVMNGIQFLKEFGNIQPQAARLILSGQSDIDVLISAINETHVYRFIAKPWDEAELRYCIAQALNFRNTILDKRDRADLYRQTHSSIEQAQMPKIYRVVLVDSDNASLTVMRRGLIQDANYEGVRGAMRQEITQRKSEDNHDFQFVVEAFSNALIVLEYMKHNDCDLVVASQRLPDMDGTQLLGEIQKIRPDTARILISDNPDKELLSKAINEAQVHGFLGLYWNAEEARINFSRQAMYVQQLKTAVMQALTTRDLLLEERRLAELREHD